MSHKTLVNVLWERGMLRDVRVLPLCSGYPLVTGFTRETAIPEAIARFNSDHWSLGRMKLL